MRWVRVQLIRWVRVQVDTSWRKAAGRLEGDPAYEAITRIDRINVYQEYIKCLSSLSFPTDRLSD